MDACSLRKYFKKMSSDIETRVFLWKPFPAANIFDPLLQLNPIETYCTVKGNATDNATQQIDHFFQQNKFPPLSSELTIMVTCHLREKLLFHRNSLTRR